MQRSLLVAFFSISLIACGGPNSATDLDLAALEQAITEPVYVSSVDVNIPTSGKVSNTYYAHYVLPGFQLGRTAPTYAKVTIRWCTNPTKGYSLTLLSTTDTVKGYSSTSCASGWTYLITSQWKQFIQSADPRFQYLTIENTGMPGFVGKYEFIIEEWM